MQGHEGNDNEICHGFQVDPKLMQRDIPAVAAFTHATEHPQNWSIHTRLGTQVLLTRVHPLQTTTPAA